MTLTPNFRLGRVLQKLSTFSDQVRQRQMEVLSFLGERFVNRARENANFNDQTGNLRSSIGYSIFDGSKIVERKVNTGNAELSAAANKTINELRLEETDIGSLVLVVFAGMEYAAAVEAKGLDVISGSVPAIEDELRELIEDLENEDFN